MQAGKKPRVLVVDDEHIIADTLAKILDLNGYEATAAYTGTSAVAAMPRRCSQTSSSAMSSCPT